MNTDRYTPRTVYVTYVRTTPKKLWTALTTGSWTERYFFGRRIESDWKVGSVFRFWQPDGTLDVEGKVVECDPSRRLCVTWRVMWIKELRKLPVNLVTYQIDDLGKLVRLTVTESYKGEVEEQRLEGGRRGWPVILSSLKSLLETGRALPQFNLSKR